MTDDSMALQVALQESEHVQGEISKAIGGMYTAFGVVIPAVFGVILFSASQNAVHLPIEFLSLALAGIFSLAILYSSSLWMEAIQGFRYKYLVLLPRVYRLAGKDSEENFLQYQARTRSLLTWLPAVLFQVLAFVLVFFVSVAGVVRGSEVSEKSPALLVAAIAVSLGIAAMGALCTQVIGRKVTKELQQSADRVRGKRESSS